MVSLIGVARPDTFPRDEFASERFDHKAGQKVVFGGKSQEAGKTTLAFKLLEYVATPALPAYVIQPKARDPVTEREGKRLNFRFVDRWPVEKKVSELGGNNPAGYIIQVAVGNLSTDADRAAKLTLDVMNDRYKAAGNKRKPVQGILVCDDTVVMSKIMKLDKEMTTHIALGGAMGLGGWYFVQKPTDSGSASIWAYENAHHSFMSKTKDKRNRIRYSEISGLEPSRVMVWIDDLHPYQFLYSNSSGEVCIVDSK